MITFMKFFPKLGCSFIKKITVHRSIALSSVQSIKQININQEKDSLVVSGVQTPPPRVEKLLKEASESNFCPECNLGLEIKHTDVLILSQYVRSDGCMLPRRITGLCKRQHRRIGTMVTMAQKAGLMPNIAPRNSKRDPQKRYQWKKFNKYFDESTIKN